jgi:hypothetical protein
VEDPQGIYKVPGATWAEPDIADAAAKLRTLYAARTTALPGERDCSE